MHLQIEAKLGPRPASIQPINFYIAMKKIYILLLPLFLSLSEYSRRSIRSMINWMLSLTCIVAKEKFKSQVLMVERLEV